MQTLVATQRRIDEIFKIRDDTRDQTALATEYRTLTDREAVLLWAMGDRRL